MLYPQIDSGSTLAGSYAFAEGGRVFSPAADESIERSMDVVTLWSFPRLFRGVRSRRCPACATGVESMAALRCRMCSGHCDCIYHQ